MSCSRSTVPARFTSHRPRVHADACASPPCRGCGDGRRSEGDRRVRKAHRQTRITRRLIAARGPHRLMVSSGRQHAESRSGSFHPSADTLPPLGRRAARSRGRSQSGSAAPVRIAAADIALGARRPRSAQDRMKRGRQDVSPRPPLSENRETTPSEPSHAVNRTAHVLADTLERLRNVTADPLNSPSRCSRGPPREPTSH